MLLVGLTGGVGAGKSTVAEALARRGARVVDADLIAREVVAPGTVGFAQVVKTFGKEYVSSDGSLDRGALAQLVFSDDGALDRLNRIVHPLVRKAIETKVEELQDADEIVVLVVPLLLESGHYRPDVVVVVDCDENVAIERVVETRGWSRDDARRRAAAQLDREARLAAADHVIENTGSPDELERQVDTLWHRLLDH